jgi:drug/metabolite transporter (DMT)-like permease
MSSTAKGQWSILAAATIWSTSGLCIKLLDWHPMVIAGGRSLLAALFLLAIRPLTARKSAAAATPPDAGTKRRNRIGLVGVGVGYCLTMVLFVVANKMTTSANAIMLQYTCPVWAGILSGIVVHEKVRRETWGALGVIFLGLLIFLRDGLGSGDLTGDAVALASGVAFGTQSVFGRLRKTGNPADGMILAHLLCIAVCAPFAAAFPPALTLPSTAAILYMGIIQIGVASFLFSTGIALVPAVPAMLIATVEPLLNPVWVLLLTGERPSLSALIGGLLIIAAVIASSLVTRLHAPKNSR